MITCVVAPTMTITPLLFLSLHTLLVLLLPPSPVLPLMSQGPNSDFDTAFIPLLFGLDGCLVCVGEV